jgi:hypothetical protein
MPNQLLETLLILGTIGVVVGIVKFTKWIIHRNTVGWNSPVRKSHGSKEELDALRRQLDLEECQRVLTWSQNLKYRHQELEQLDFWVNQQKAALGFKLQLGKYESYQDYSNDFDKLMERKKELYEEINKKYSLNSSVR